MSTLYSDNPSGKPPRVKLQYGTAEKARASIKRLRKIRDPGYRKVAAITMYNRAKYHKYQTDGMRAAAKVYKSYIKSL
jgi:hypothetical protein